LEALARENGVYVAWFLRAIFPDAVSVIGRVERYVLNAHDQAVVDFMRPYTSSFSMIGIAVRGLQTGDRMVYVSGI
jgi:hypothetical protein